LSKYKLWKALHELGFRYAKINGNKKALVERKDLVNKRIIFLRTNPFIKYDRIHFGMIISSICA
jgi:hypothetical protein